MGPEGPGIKGKRLSFDSPNRNRSKKFLNVEEKIAKDGLRYPPGVRRKEGGFSGRLRHEACQSRQRMKRVIGGPGSEKWSYIRKKRFRGRWEGGEGYDAGRENTR